MRSLSFAIMAASPKPDKVFVSIPAEVMSKIVAERLVDEVESSGFVVMQKPPAGGSSSPLQYPDGWPHTKR